MTLAGGQDVVLDPPHEDGVCGLLGDEVLQTPFAGHPLGFDDFAGGDGAATEIADLALVDEVAECPQGFVDVGVGPWAVYLVEVDPVGVEAALGVLDGADDPAPGAALAVRILALAEAGTNQLSLHPTRGDSLCQVQRRGAASGVAISLDQPSRLPGGSSLFHTSGAGRHELAQPGQDYHVRRG